MLVLMNSRELRRRISLLLIVAFAFSILAGGVARSSFAQAPPGMVEVSGKYTNEKAGVEMVFPDGWTGFETSTGSITAATAIEPSTANSNFPKLMTLSIVPKAEAKDAAQAKAEMEKSDVKCSDPTVTSTAISGKSGQMYTIECSRPDGTQYKMKGAYVLTDSRQVNLLYMSKLADFAADESKFEAALSSLKVSGAVDTTTTNPPSNLGQELKSYIHSVLVKGKNVNLDLKSNSTISNLKMEEQNKRLSFTVEGQSGTHGTTEIPIGKILDGPYVVTVDGQQSTNFQVTNEGTSNAALRISYTHSTHDITVSGTNVVPEFPVVMLGVITAVVIGMIAVIGRIKPFSNTF